MIKMMNTTVNKVILGFMILVVFDATSFSIEKSKFGMLGSVAHVISTVKNTVRAFR